MYRLRRIPLAVLSDEIYRRVIHMSRFFSLLEWFNCSILATLAISVVIIDNNTYDEQKIFLTVLILSCLGFNFMGLVFTRYGFKNSVTRFINGGRLLRKTATIPTATLYMIIFDHAANHEYVTAYACLLYVVLVFAVFFRLSLLNRVFIYELVPRVNTTSSYER